jgi:hypothetical protein
MYKSKFTKFALLVFIFSSFAQANEEDLKRALRDGNWPEVKRLLQSEPKLIKFRPDGQHTLRWHLEENEQWELLAEVDASGIGRQFNIPAQMFGSFFGVGSNGAGFIRVTPNSQEASGITNDEGDCVISMSDTEGVRVKLSRESCGSEERFSEREREREFERMQREMERNAREREREMASAQREVERVQREQERAQRQQRFAVPPATPPQGFRGDWTGSFKLKDGSEAVHTPKSVSAFGSTSGRSVSLSRRRDGDVSTQIRLLTDSTREEFYEALKAAGLID